MLIRAGASRNAMDNQGYTAVAFSCSFNHLSFGRAAPRKGGSNAFRYGMCSAHASHLTPVEVSLLSC